MSQNEEILEYMREHGWITPMDAIMHLGCTKLATRISELIRSGHRIEKQTVWYENRKHQKRHYTQYRLVV